LPLLGNGVQASADGFWTQASDRYEQRRHDIERPLLPPDALYLPPDALRERLNQGTRVEVVDPQDARHGDAATLPSQPAPELLLAAREAEPAGALKRFLASYPGRVLIAADSAGRREALLEVLAAAGVEATVVADVAAVTGVPSSGAARSLLPQAGEGNARLSIAVAPLDDGFAIDAPAVCILTERQLFPERASQPRRRKRVGREPEAIIRDLGELTEGAP